LNLFNSPQKTKRSLPEEAECGSVEGIKVWLREGNIKKKAIYRNIYFYFNIIGADIDAADAYGYTPLMNAAMLGRVAIVKALIDAGADIQKKGQFGYTALHAAAQNGHLDVVQTLVKYGASVNCKNDDGDIPLILGKRKFVYWKILLGFFSIAVRGTHAEIIDYLLKAGSDIHQNGWLGQSAVHTASKF
jgi:cytohesin